MEPRVSTIQELNDRGTIGFVEPFASNNTRYVHLRPKELKELAERVYSNYTREDWVTLAVTPNYPVAVYPTDSTPIESERGIALAPGLKPETYAELTGEK